MALRPLDANAVKYYTDTANSALDRCNQGQFADEWVTVEEDLRAVLAQLGESETAHVHVDRFLAEAMQEELLAKEAGAPDYIKGFHGLRLLQRVASLFADMLHVHLDIRASIDGHDEDRGAGADAGSRTLPPGAPGAIDDRAIGRSANEGIAPDRDIHASANRGQHSDRAIRASAEDDGRERGPYSGMPPELAFEAAKKELIRMLITFGRGRVNLCLPQMLDAKVLKPKELGALTNTISKLAQRIKYHEEGDGHDGHGDRLQNT